MAPRPQPRSKSSDLFKVNALYVAGDNDKKAIERIGKLFTPLNKREAQKLTKESDGLCGNLHLRAHYDMKRKRTVIENVHFDLNRDEQGKFSLWRMISASLALYRTLCLFPDPTVVAEGSLGDKQPWIIYLKHNESGCVLGISEWKGAFGFYTKFHTKKEAPKSFIRDICRLMSLILSEKCPHPYGSLVAGSVA